MDVVLQSIEEESQILHDKEVQDAIEENKLLKITLDQLDNENEDLLKQYETLKRCTTLKKKKRDYLKRKLIHYRKCCVGEQKNLLRKVFTQSQIDVLLNKQKVCWTDDDMAMAFTLRQIGNRETYLYLKEILNIPLPSLSSVQRWAASK